MDLCRLHQLVPGHVGKPWPDIRSGCTHDAVDCVQLLDLVITLEDGFLGEKFQHDCPEIVRVQCQKSTQRKLGLIFAHPALHMSTAGP